MDIDKKQLINSALKAKEFSYAPYSGFHVGAALLAKDGSIHTGCNVENAAFSPTICAERTAITKAVSEGHREFRAIAVTGDSDYTYPCGVCRQVLREFGADILIIVANTEEDYTEMKLGELLPHSFGPDDLADN